MKGLYARATGTVGQQYDEQGRRIIREGDMESLEHFLEGWE